MSTNRPVRVAVVGTGYLGRFHAQKYAQLEGADLVAVVDADPDRAAAVAAECGTEAATDLAEVVDRIDAASVVVPTSLHHAVAMPLLEAGCHVLLEKPIAPTLAEADALIAMAAQAGAVLQIGHLERFNPAIVTLKERTHLPLFVEAHRLSRFSGRATDVDIVVDLMIHDIDILLDLVGEPVTAVQAVGAPVVTGRVDIANARLEFAGGCTANLTASRIASHDMRRFRLFQPGGFLSADCAAQANQVVSGTAIAADLGDGNGGAAVDAAAYGAASAGPVPEVIEHPRADTLRTEIEAFLAAVRGERKPAVTGQAARAALAVALRINEDIAARTAAIRSARGGQGERV
ncbi:MAG TPA: Gfo/Idh/MocA family oxidoreductase [Candidatus Krumholzibacteria bacterium]|nr:Gfo/Idh/MocA family oxidoreductase [Candidatus Krumholzibacteria bacterium]